MKTKDIKDIIKINEKSKKIKYYLQRKTKKDVYITQDFLDYFKKNGFVLTVDNKEFHSYNELDKLYTEYQENLKKEEEEKEEEDFLFSSFITPFKETSNKSSFSSIFSSSSYNSNSSGGNVLRRNIVYKHGEKYAYGIKIKQIYSSEFGVFIDNYGDYRNCLGELIYNLKWYMKACRNGKRF